MKTHLYYGPVRDLLSSTNPEDSPSMCFGTVGECQEWLRQRLLSRASKSQRNVWPSSGSPDITDRNAVVEKAENVTYNPTMTQERCGCSDIGLDGHRTCSARPHVHRLRLPSATTPKARNVIMRLCDNHVQGFLRAGWKAEVRRLCGHCTTNEAKIGDYLCEACANSAGPMTDSVRIKQEGYCLNRDTVHGCLIWAEKGSQMCTHCLNYFKHSAAPSTRIRPIATSARPCTLTPGCAGNMLASVRLFVSTRRPELWWSCAVCRVSKMAEGSRAIADPRTEAVVQEQVEDMRIAAQLRMDSKTPARPVGADMMDMSEHVREMILEADDG